MKSASTGIIPLNEYILNSMRRCVLLQPLEDDDFDKVVNTSHAKQLPENSVLFEQGTELTDIYLLISGGIKLQRLAPNGDEKVIEIIRPGQTFAEAVLFLGGSRYPVSALTVSPSIVVAINAETYLKLLNTSNTLCKNLLGKLSQRLHWMVNEVDRLTLHNATFRLVDYLLSHISEEQNDRAGVTLVAPKHVIASRLSIKPETLSRTLKDLSKQGLINLDGTQIELVNVEKLRQLISLEG
ncbi:MAG: cyclic nucleotide-binding domain-containing protein [Methylophaga sp.]|nr:cyclic nucleotide-binding domain-containing protein [Methylophaga sp.]